MRFHLLCLVLLAGISTPALAQSAEAERRIERLEQQLRVLQRRVFPDGRPPVMPEIQAQQVVTPGGIAGSDVMTSLGARVDAMEQQLRTLTSQIEEQGYRNRQLEQQVVRLEAELSGRLDRLEAAPAAIQPTRDTPLPEESGEEPTETEAPAASGETPSDGSAGAEQAAADPAEEAYNVGFRHWDAGRYGQAQQALEDAAKQFPRSPWTSWMRNLQGRAYLDDNKPATAARIFLANYQDNPRGARAADSLLFLGEALTRLDRSAEACRVYDELEQVYPSMRAFIRERLPQAREAARCEAAG